MRKFELNVLDFDFNIIDRFNLDFVTSPSGLGFEQDVDLVEGRTIDYIIDQVLRKKAIKLIVHFEEPYSYTKIEEFKNWYLKNFKSKCALKYSIDKKDKYIDVFIQRFDVTEISAGANSVALELKPISPFYRLKAKTILASIESIGRKYPFVYPYQYGGGGLVNNIIENDFFEPVPLIVKIKGPIVNPEVGLKKLDNSIYSQVKFSDVTLTTNQMIVIDAINQRVVYYDSEFSQGEDYYNYVNKAFNTFLYANPGESIVFANLNELELDSNIQISFAQFTL